MYMSREFRTSVATLTAAAAFFVAGCSSESGESSTFGPNRAEVQASYDAALQYWTEQGVKIGGLTLQTVVEGSVLCDDSNGSVQIGSLSLSRATYCSDERRIIISGRTYDYALQTAQEDGISAEAVSAAVVSHEVGHDILFLSGMSGLITDQKKESIADCLAGVVVAATRPELGKQSEDLLKTMGGDYHGSAEQRGAAFTNGFTRDISYCNAALPTMLGIPG